jgi:GNAT superfamily N-acetyltransferase
MRPADVEAAAEVANSVHELAYREGPAVVRDRLAIYPPGCFVLETGETLQGQLISHPWIRASLPPLDTILGSLPAAPDCYYLHDLVLVEAARGRGHAAEAVDLAIGQARAGGFDLVLLVAVSAAHPYWERAGFERCADLRPNTAKGYGPEARAYMRRL